MNHRTDIVNELMNISPLVAGIGKENVFAVPEGYFDSISPTVLLCLKEEEPLIGQFETTAAVPEGYFDGLAGNILNKIKTQQPELAEEIPAFFSQISKEQPFEIPVGYFESLSDTILSAIQMNEERMPEIFTGIDKSNPFEIPAGYFDTLSDKVLSAVNASGGEAMPVIFETVSKKIPYEVPAGYFDTLSNNILAKVKSSGGRVVKMSARFSFFKYAVAALFTGALALGIYKYSTNRGTQTGTTSVALNLDPSIEKGKAMDEKSFNESLDNLSEEAIVKYLEKNGNEADVSVLTSNMENISLPEQEDYLLDDNTLNNFLKDLKNSSN